jgi:hypothetical protein
LFTLNFDIKKLSFAMNCATNSKETCERLAQGTCVAFHAIDDGHTFAFGTALNRQWQLATFVSIDGKAAGGKRHGPQAWPSSMATSGHKRNCENCENCENCGENCEIYPNLLEINGF